MKKGLKNFSKGKILLNWDRTSVGIIMREGLTFGTGLYHELMLIAKDMMGSQQNRRLSVYIVDPFTEKDTSNTEKLMAETFSLISYIKFLIDEFDLEIDTYGFGKLSNASLMLFLIGQQRIISELSFVTVTRPLIWFLRDKRDFLTYVKKTTSQEFYGSLLEGSPESIWDRDSLVKSGVGIDKIYDAMYPDDDEE